MHYLSSDNTDIPVILRECQQYNIELIQNTSYFLKKIRKIRRISETKNTPLLFYCLPISLALSLLVSHTPSLPLSFFYPPLIHFLSYHLLLWPCVYIFITMFITREVKMIQHFILHQEHVPIVYWDILNRLGFKKIDLEQFQPTPKNKLQHLYHVKTILMQSKIQIGHFAMRKVRK